MKFRLLIPLVLIAGQQPLPGESLDGLKRKGESAMADQLWEIAGLHFKECLRDRSLAPEQKSQIAVQLAESMVRAGNPAEALDLLGQSFASGNPAAAFWRAQALAGQRRFTEAAEILGGYLEMPAPPHRIEAAFTRASLLLALDKPDEALAGLEKAAISSEPDEACRIHLFQVEILLDQQRNVEARATMPPLAGVPATERPLAELLEARIELGEGHPIDAASRLQDLLALPKSLTLSDHQSAMILLADATRAQGSPNAASKILITELQNHPDSPLLEPVFQRILRWLPEKTSSSDLVFGRVKEWTKPSTSATASSTSPTPWLNTLPTSEGGAAVSAWPVESDPLPNPDFSAYALYTSAVCLQRMQTAESAFDAILAFNRLRLEFPNHPLAARSLYQQARWLLDDGSTSQALSLLETLRAIHGAPELKGEAAFLEARTATLDGHPEKAIALFDEAAAALEGNSSRLAKVQSAISRLRSGDSRGVTLILEKQPPPDAALAADLELEQSLAAPAGTPRRTAIHGFLLKHPDHPRAAEARLVAIEANLSSTEPDLAEARDQLKALETLPADAANLPARRIAAARLRILDLSSDPVTAGSAQALIDTYPGTREADEAALTLGRNLFESGDYNQAGIGLKELAESTSDTTLIPAAWLIAARAAALGATPQSKQEALARYDKAIQAGGPLASVATLERARHLIDLYRFPEAMDFLKTWIRKLPENDPLHLPAGLLLGEALFAQSGSKPEALEQALEVYNKLLEHSKDYPALVARLQYLRGQTLEKLPDPADPTKTRENEAFQAYHSVLETDGPPPEWEFFELCGSRSLALLEKAGRWRAAILVARKIASFKGPHAAEAAEHASKIQLDQMIYEDL